MSPFMKKMLTSKITIWIFYRLIRLYCLTFRLKIENERPWLDHIHSGGRVLLCTWHQHFFSFIRHFRNYRTYEPGLMISQSSDGEIIAGIANLSGWQTVRGSSSRNGTRALRQMIKHLKKTGLAAHILDGPRGPSGTVKHGAIYLAMGADAMIVPVIAVAEKAWYFRSWDRFMLPRPFSRVTIRYGDMIPCRADDHNNDAVEAHRKRLQKILSPSLFRG
jgi:lysophospholipid acyltransferase (LPLAT)-like uncharacterized protein